MLMTNQQPTKLSQPGVGPLYNPATLVTPQFSSVFVSAMLVVVPVEDDQFDAAFPEPLTERVRIVSAIGNHALRLLSRTTFWPWCQDLDERGFRKCNFIGRGTFQPNSQRNTFTLDQYHPLCGLATLGFTDSTTPFFAGVKLLSKKFSSQSSRPCVSSAPKSVRQAFNQTPASSHCCSHQQVEGEGNFSGKKRHTAPVCRIPQNTFKTSSIQLPRPTPLVSPTLRTGKQRPNQTPTAHRSTVSVGLHDRSSPVKLPQT